METFTVNLEGGSPWGFSIQGGVDHRSPLRVGKVGWFVGVQQALNRSSVSLELGALKCRLCFNNCAIIGVE